VGCNKGAFWWQELELKSDTSAPEGQILKYLYLSITNDQLIISCKENGILGDAAAKTKVDFREAPNHTSLHKNNK